jgi:hypothetical protein
VQGQYFSNLQNGDTSTDFACNILRRPDNTLFVLSNGGYTGGGGYLLFSMVTNADASQQLNKQFIKSDTFSYSFGYTGRVKTTTNGYLMDVTMQGPSSPQNGFTSQAMLARYDIQGNTILLKSYTDTNLNFDYTWDCAVLQDGSYLLGGSRENISLTDFPAVLWHTDSSGNLIWEHIYDIVPGNVTKVNSLDTLDDNRILIGLYSRSIAYTNATHDYYSNQPWFIIIDTTGTILRDTFYSSGRYSGGGFIFKDKTGGYFHYGTLDSVFNPNYIDEPANFPQYVSHLDTNFRIDWLTSFITDTGIAKNIWAVKQLHDSGYIIVGNYYDYPMHVVGWAAKVNRYGTVVWDNIYPDYPQNDAYLVDAIELHDHNFIMVGSAKDVTLPTWREYDAWILGIDSNGCEINGCTPTGIKGLNRSIPSLSLSPNPSSGVFTVETPVAGALRLYNLQGQSLAQFRIAQGKTSLSFPGNAPAGVYIAKFISNDAGVQVARMIYQP